MNVKFLLLADDYKVCEVVVDHSISAQKVSMSLLRWYCKTYSFNKAAKFSVLGGLSCAELAMANKLNLP